MAGIKSRHVAVHVKAETFEAAQSHSKATGIPITKITDQALAYWLQTVGAVQLEALANNHAKAHYNNVISMPIPAPILPQENQAPAAEITGMP